MIKIFIFVEFLLGGCLMLTRPRSFSLFFLLFPLFLFGDFDVIQQEGDDECIPLSLPEEVEDLFLKDSDLIEGILSPLNGLPVLQEIDLIARGAENLVLSRKYLATQTPNHYSTILEFEEYFRCLFLHKHIRGWTFLPHLNMRKVDKGPGDRFRFTYPSGTTLEYLHLGKDLNFGFEYTCIPNAPYGLSNYSEGLPSGKFDARNARIHYEGDYVVIKAPDGAKYYYKKHSDRYLLQKEVRLNGKIWRYKYTSNGKLQRIESLDPKEEYIYASIDVEGSPESAFCSFSSHSGQKASYNYLVKKLEAKKKAKIKGHKIEKSISCNSRPILISVESPFHPNENIEYDRSFMLQHYDSLQNPFQCTHALSKKEDDLSFYKVNKIKTPVGLNWHDLHSITYDSPIGGKKTGTTTVSSSDGTKVVYEFTDNLLLKSKQIYDIGDKLRKEKILEWNVNNTLASIQWQSDSGLLLKKSYAYDGWGNPILETIEGKLSGGSEQDSYTISRRFSNDGFHLIIIEKKEEGPTFEFTYLPQTNLVTGEYTEDGNKIILRKFYVYDQWNNLIKTISDNGSAVAADTLTDVTQRTITEYHLRQNSPHLHMIDWIEEKYLDKGQEILLRKTHLSYDDNGQVIQEDVYDCNDSYCYSLYKAYNSKGQLIEETNPIGQRATYTYDDRGDLIESVPFSHQFKKIMKYDLKGRLLEEHQLGVDGNNRDFYYSYDLHGRLIHKQNHLKHITEYCHDLVVNKPTETKLPSLLHDTEIPVIKKSSFDPWGREIETWDANGNKTTRSYNAYGSPTEIIHPDGSKEQNFYSKNGQLIKSIDPEGNYITYKRDCLDRVILKEYFSSNGEKQASEIFEYDAYHLRTWIDKEGHATSYFYDGAGRKIKKQSADKIVHYSYNALGGLSSKTIENGDHSLKITYTRDLLDRITEETKSDLNSKICYAYDQSGNISEETRWIDGQEASQSYAYDSLNRLILKQSPLNGSTHIRYDESNHNSLLQTIAKKITVDEKNVITTETFDPYGNIVKKEKSSGHDNSWLSCQTKKYDPCGNLIEQKDFATEKQAHLLTHAYSSKNQMIHSIRAFGTPNERKTSYQYHPSGRIESKTLPNGVTLHYFYSPLGYLERRTSSDETIDHSFKYNKNGSLTNCKDNKSGVEVIRELDPFGNILSEKISTGLYLEKTYDCLDQPSKLFIPNVGEILYQYNPCTLAKIKRVDTEGNCLYTHSFNSYDLSGHVLEESLIGDLGKVSYSYDLEGRLTSIHSPYFNEEYKFSQEGNMIERKSEEKSYHYSYDALDQLIEETRGEAVDSYTCDALYQRQDVNGQKACFNELHELLQQDKTAFAYDLNGNLIQKENARFLFNALNQLTHAHINGKEITYLYDPLGRCIKKIRGEEEENYLYDANHEIGAFTSDLTLKQLRILDGRKQFPKTVAIEIDHKPYASLTDAQGNIRLLIDPKTKTITEKYDFTAFGTPLTSSEAVNPWRFASKRLDPDLKWIQFGKRFYDPFLARWITTDPAGFTDSVNLYQYLFNNPFRYKDPDGRFAWAIPLFVWGGKAAGISFVVPTLAEILSATIAAAAVVAVYNEMVNQEIADAAVEGMASIPDADESEKRKKPKPLPNGDPRYDSEWEDISHESARENDKYTFKHKETGEEILWHPGTPGEPGHRGRDHYHRPNPDSNGKRDYYLDNDGNPVPKGHENSHLYPDP